jgi:hypothetical protein
MRDLLPSQLTRASGQSNTHSTATPRNRERGPSRPFAIWALSLSLSLIVPPSSASATGAGAPQKPRFLGARGCFLPSQCGYLQPRGPAGPAALVYETGPNAYHISYHDTLRPPYQHIATPWQAFDVPAMRQHSPPPAQEPGSPA